MIGEKIQQLRKDNSMSQEELASKLTISRQAISKWELGDSIPDTENVVQLSKIFSVSTDYLLSDEHESCADYLPVAEINNEKESEISSGSADAKNTNYCGIKQYINKPALWIIVAAIIVALPLSVILISEVLKRTTDNAIYDLPTRNESNNTVTNLLTIHEIAETIQETPPPVVKPVAVAYGERQVFDFTLREGERITLNALAEITNPRYDSIVWTSSNQSIFEVVVTNSTGTEADITAISRGTATLTVAQGFVQTRCTVRVTQNESGAKEYDAITPSLLPLNFAWPLPGYRDIVVGFGIQLHPIEQMYFSHNGIDIAAPIESPVVASEAGTVIDIGGAKEEGFFIILDHGNGIQTIYSNLQGHAEGLVVGDTVDKGYVIGYVGNAENEEDPHLHFGMMEDNRDTDPMKYF